MKTVLPQFFKTKIFLKNFIHILQYLITAQRIEVFNAMQKNIVLPKDRIFYSNLYKFLKRFTTTVLKATK